MKLFEFPENLLLILLPLLLTTWDISSSSLSSLWPRYSCSSSAGLVTALLSLTGLGSGTETEVSGPVGGVDDGLEVEAFVKKIEQT